ncbi:hypothetical protein [Palaeococcus sp. (in: euryarchaeotes)]
MDIIGILGIAISVIREILTALDELKKRELKEELASVIEEPLLEAKDAIEKLADDVAYSLAAYLMYSLVFVPFEPEEKAREIIGTLDSDYERAKIAIRELAHHLKTHKDTLFKTLALKPHQRILLEKFIALADENIKPLDLKNYQKQFIEGLFETSKERERFSREFSRLIEEFNEKHGFKELNAALGLDEKRRESLVECALPHIIGCFQKIQNLEENTQTKNK